MCGLHISLPHFFFLYSATTFCSFENQCPNQSFVNHTLLSSSVLQNCHFLFFLCLTCLLKAFLIHCIQSRQRIDSGITTVPRESIQNDHNILR